MLDIISATILAGTLSGSVIAQTPDAGCALLSEPQGIPAALGAAIHAASSQAASFACIVLA